MLSFKSVAKLLAFNTGYDCLERVVGTDFANIIGEKVEEKIFDYDERECFHGRNKKNRVIQIKRK